MATRIGDIMTPLEKYQHNGEEKTRWGRVGVLLQTDKGYRIKLDMIPVDFSETGGWLSVFEPRDNRQQGQQSQQSGFRQQMDDDNPFKQ